MGKYCLLLGMIMCYAPAQDVHALNYISSTEAHGLHSTRQRPETSRDKWLSQDKFLHFSACAAISGFAYHISVHRFEEDMHRGRVYSVSITALIGIGKELYDKKKKNHFSWKDLLWDGLGIGVGYLVFVR